jgi:hypothetical protein
MERAKGLLKGFLGGEDQTSLSRRDALAGLGFAGVLLAAPKLLALTPAEAKPLDKTAGASRDAKAHASDNQGAEADTGDAAGVTDVSAQRYWRRRYWRRRYYRPYWRRRYWRRRYWRRRYW